MPFLTIQDLASTSIEKIVQCFLQSFEGYFVPLPQEIGYWQARFSASGVDYSLSFGVFDDEHLVAFIIHCVGVEEGKKIVFNTGTGVLPAYRGQGLIDRLYAHAIPVLIERGCSTARLEVIDQNARAIRVYKRIGMRIKRRLKCYQGAFSDHPLPEVRLEKSQFGWVSQQFRSSEKYSWDHTLETLSRAENQFDVMRVMANRQDELIGYFILDRAKGHLAQLEVMHNQWDELFSGIRQLTTTIKINNIDSCRTSLIEWLEKAGIPNVIDQYEMEMPLEESL